MTVDLDDYRQTVRRWLLDAPVPAPPTSEEERFATQREWQRVLYEAGYVGVSWPREWGGRGQTLRHQQVVNEELSRVRAPHPIGLIGLEVVGPSIGRFGTAEQRERLLPPLLSGADIWCQGFSEPGAGSDLASLTTRAVRDGDDYVVTGQKVWTSWAHKASWCALVVRTDATVSRHRGLSYLLVDMRSPGVDVRPLVQLTGEAEFNEVFFDEVRVPASSLLGEAGAGWTIAMDSLSHERGTYVLRRRAEISNAFHQALDGLADLSDHLVATVGAAETSLRALRAQTWATLQRLESGVSEPALDSMDKVVLTNVEQQVGHCLRELLGTSVSAWDAETGSALRDYLFSRAISIYSGTTQIQNNIIAQRHLDSPVTDALTAELLEASRRVLEAQLPTPAGFDPQPHISRWNQVHPHLEQLGWFDLLGSLGLSPALAVRLVRLAGTHLVPGPLVEATLTVPWLLAQPDVDAGALHDVRGSVAVIDLPDTVLVGGSLKGTASCVLGAGDTDALLVHVHDGEREQLVVVPATQDGVSITPLRGADPCQPVGRVTFDCTVGDEQVVRSPAGLPTRLRAWTRLGDAAYLAGITERVLALGVDHARTREQFGRPIGAFQAVQHLLAEVAISARSLANVVDFAAEELVAADEHEAEILGATAKARAGTEAVLACETVLQVLGGMGFTVDHPLHHYLKRALSLAARHGSPAELHLLVGRSVLAQASTA